MSNSIIEKFHNEIISYKKTKDYDNEDTEYDNTLYNIENIN